MFQEENSFSISNQQSAISNYTSRWQKQDTVWMLSLYGTAVGAGVLFLPINAGLHGIWPLIAMLILAFPMTYFSHQALCRFVLSSSSEKSNIIEVAEEHFGGFAGKLINLLYFFAIYPILLMYSVAITNTTQSFIVNQIGVEAPPRGLLAIILILSLIIIVRFGQQFIIRSMNALVYPFVGILLLLSIYLIPYWNSNIFQQDALQAEGSHGLLTTLWLIIPVMIFAFNHSPIISSFAVKQKQHYGINADKKSSQILKYSHLLMIMTVMFFVFSCVLSLSPYDLKLAKQQNISILSYLANHFEVPFIAYIAPIIAFIAIAQSFLGHYLGASEGLNGLLGKRISADKLSLFIKIFIVVSCWVTATINPNILKIIETLSGPIIAIILFLMPMYAMAKIPTLKKYRRPISHVFILSIGLIALSAMFYGFMF